MEEREERARPGYHNLKGHLVIRWILPSGRIASAERAAHAPPEEGSSAGEQALAALLIRHDT